MRSYDTEAAKLWNREESGKEGLPIACPSQAPPWPAANRDNLLLLPRLLASSSEERLLLFSARSTAILMSSIHFSISDAELKEDCVKQNPKV